MVFNMAQVNHLKIANQDEWDAFDEWVHNTPGMCYSENIGVYMWKLVDKGYPLDYVWNNVARWHETTNGQGIHIHFNDPDDNYEMMPYHILEKWRDSESGKWREQLDKFPSEI